MKPYGRNHELTRCRDWPDKADAVSLGLPSRYGKLKSKGKRQARRLYKKAARRALKKEDYLY